MFPYFREVFGNAASATHQWGWRAKAAVDMAREQLAAAIGAEEGELVFTSGSTEAINLAIKGVFHLYQKKGRHIVTVKTEHKAVLDTCRYLEKYGAEVTYLDVDADGRINLQALEEAITEKTILVAVMLANNETGILHPVEKIAAIVHNKASIFLSDATQAFGKIPVNVHSTGIDLMPVSAHKIYGPKGVGALYVRRKNPRVSLEPLLHGGGHEHGLRSGTLNVPGVVGLGRAASMTGRFIKEYLHIATLRDQLETMIIGGGFGRVNGDTDHRLPNTSSICLQHMRGETFIKNTQAWLGVAMGSACTSIHPEPSHVLRAMGLDVQEAGRSVRFSWGIENTGEELSILQERLGQILQQEKN